MLKHYLQENNRSIYALAKECNMSYSTLNDLVNHKTPIANLKSGHLFSLSKALQMSMEELYQMLSFSPIIMSEKHHVAGSVQVKKKAYYIVVEQGGVDHERYLFPVNAQSSKYLSTIAGWQLDEMLDEIKMEETYAALLAKKKR